MKDIILNVLAFTHLWKKVAGGAPAEPLFALADARVLILDLDFYQGILFCVVPPVVLTSFFDETVMLHQLVHN